MVAVMKMSTACQTTIDSIFQSLKNLKISKVEKLKKVKKLIWKNIRENLDFFLLKHILRVSRPLLSRVQIC